MSIQRAMRSVSCIERCFLKRQHDARGSSCGGIMGFYQERMLPRLIDLAMRHSPLLPYRSRVVRAATGRVLEIGIGSGLNLPFYGKAITQVLGLDPSPKLLDMARNAATPTSIPLDLVQGSATDIPIE